MVKKQSNNSEFEVNTDFYKMWSNTCGGVSKMWDETHSKLVEPMIELMVKMSQKTDAISADPSLKNYKEFYDEWMKTYETSFGEFYPVSIPTPRETLENFVKMSEESSKLYRSWIEESEKNAKKTSELLKNGADPSKFKECYDMWMNSFDRMSNEFVEQPNLKYQKEIFEKYTGMPDFYSDSLMKMSEIWKDSFRNLYAPWMDSMQKLSQNIEKISKGNATPDNYKEFFDLWANTYKNNYRKMFDLKTAISSREALDNFIESSEVSLHLYKSWISALENMHEKFKDHSKVITDPGAYEEFFNLWVRMHEKALEDVFEKMPLSSPTRDLMEPVRNACKIYAAASLRNSKMWMDSCIRSTRQGL